MNVLVRRRTNKAARLATVVLLLIAFVSNSMMYAYAAGGETFSFAIGETTFTVTPGSDPFVTSTTEGAVEIATANGAVIWANLGGAGSGSLTESMISGLENVPYTLFRQYADIYGLGLRCHRPGQQRLRHTGCRRLNDDL